MTGEIKSKILNKHSGLIKGCELCRPRRQPECCYQPQLTGGCVCVSVQLTHAAAVWVLCWGWGCLIFFLQVENVRLLDRVSPRRSRVGTLYLTATHTIFVENEAGVRNETWVGNSSVHWRTRHQLGRTHSKCLGMCLVRRPQILSKV